MGWLYTRLVASNSFAPEYRTAGENDENEREHMNGTTSASQRTRLSNSVKEFMAMFVFQNYYFLLACLWST